MATYDLASATPTYSALRAGDIINCSYSGAKKSISLPAGTYKLEVWGAQGGSRSNAYLGGCGGYSTGVLTLTTKTTLYLYAGGQATSMAGGFNGGGNGYKNGYGGGGASDIRIAKDSLYARVIVAGAGGGSAYIVSGKGVGGGTQGLGGHNNETTLAGSNRSGGGGTQTAGGQPWSLSVTTYPSAVGSFGKGGTAGAGQMGYLAGGGGAGWYGGGGAYDSDSDGDGRSGGGGSGYIYTSSTASNYPSGCLLNSAYYLSNASTVAGNTSFTGPTGATETGHSGNGYARITILTTTGKTTYQFNANGGTSTPSSIIVNWGSTGTLPAAINRISQGINFSTLCYGAGGTDVTATGLKTANYTFATWNTNSSGTGTNYNAGSSVSPSGNANDTITLYAKWNTSYTYSANNQIKTIPAPTRATTTTSFTITGNCNGGINNTSTVGKQITSYTFTGWNSQYDGKGTAYSINSTETFNESTILYAQWASTISYQNNTVNLLPIPSRVNYTFTGWNTAANGSGGAYPQGSTAEIKTAQTLYAQWQRNPYNYVPFIYTNGAWVKMTPLIYENGQWTNRLVDLK